MLCKSSQNRRFISGTRSSDSKGKAPAPPPPPPHPDVMKNFVDAITALVQAASPPTRYRHTGIDCATYARTTITVALQQPPHLSPQ